MGKPLDIAGRRFGRLVAIERVGTSPTRKPLWKCACDCGETAICTSRNLVTGNSNSCGCYKSDRLTETKTIHGRNGTDPTYGTWYSMRQRCNNPRSHKYPSYGGRGISICKAWDEFNGFLADMGERPVGKTIDRINNDGNYEPGNCRWATSSEQRNNQRQKGISA